VPPAAGRAGDLSTASGSRWRGVRDS